MKGTFILVLILGLAVSTSTSVSWAEDSPEGVVVSEVTKDNILTDAEKDFPVKQQLLIVDNLLREGKKKLHVERQQYYEGVKAEYQAKLDDTDLPGEERKSILKEISAKVQEEYGIKYVVERQELKPYFELRDELRQKSKISE